MSVIYKAIGTVLAWFDRFLGSYLLSILLFALIIKIILLPFSIKQQKNTQKQASLRPKEMAIKKKYAGRENDQSAMQQMQVEIQEMYRANNYNQFAGCLPMLIQLPIILVVYQAIYKPLSYISKLSSDVIESIKAFIGANYEFFNISASNISDKGIYNGSELQIVSILNHNEYLQKIGETIPEVLDCHVPNFMLGNVNLGAVPGQVWGWLVIIPILVFLAQFGSMKLSRKMSYQPVTVSQQQQGCSNWIMDITMPLMTFVLAFTFPALLGIYWIFQSVLGVLQQFILKLIFPLPTFTEQDYKDAERAMRGKGPKAGAGRTVDTGKKYRSLHNIDADDE